MSAHVFFYFLNELKKHGKMQDCAEHLIVFCNEVNNI